MRIIVQNLSGFYESIHTEDATCILELKIKYALKGYKVFRPSEIWMDRIYRWSGKKFNPWFRIGQNNMFFEKFDPSKNQVTFHSPWDNFL